jgi:hypothetical protein
MICTPCAVLLCRIGVDTSERTVNINSRRMKCSKQRECKMEVAAAAAAAAAAAIILCQPARTHECHWHGPAVLLSRASISSAVLSASPHRLRRRLAQTMAPPRPHRLELHLRLSTVE